MENDLFVKYDSLCYATMTNIRILTSQAERIAFRNFNYNNKEHKFVLAVAMACWNVLGGKPIAVDTGVLTRNKINKEYSSTCKVDRVKQSDTIFVNVEEMLEFMRGPALGLCGESFTFGDIYDAYYSGKED